MTDVVQHVVVFLNAAGENMMSVAQESPEHPSDAVQATDRVEAKVRSGKYGSMTGLTFLYREIRDASWRADRDAQTANAA